MGRLSELDAVTIDAYGTLVTLVDPVPALQAALAARCVERNAEQVGAAFRAEAAYYTPRSHERPLEDRRRRCVAVFLEAAGAALDVNEFVGPYIEALVFEPLPGAVEAVRRLRAHGVALAVIAWREFGAPYGLFAALSLALPLSVPSSRWPLLSLPRFGLVVFPFFLALAWLGGRHVRAHAAIVGCSAILLGVFVTQWALWNWVA